MSCEIETSNFIRGTGGYISIKVWKILNGKLDAASFVIKSSRKLIMVSNLR